MILSLDVIQDCFVPQMVKEINKNKKNQEKLQKLNFEISS